MIDTTHIMVKVVMIIASVVTTMAIQAMEVTAVMEETAVTVESAGTEDTGDMVAMAV